jgi:hypothetical protein
MIKWLLKQWRANQRATDLSVLWPACKEYAPTIEHARVAFFMHVINDDAWTKDFSDEALIDYIGSLEL